MQWFERVRLSITSHYQVSKIKNCAFFDPEWYLRVYPDIKQNGMDPALHYLVYGAREGRNPSSRFSTINYRERHPEIAKTSENPLIHAIRHGLDADAPPPYPIGPLVDPVRDRAINLLQARANPTEVAASERSLREFCTKLPKPEDYDGVGRVPRIFHFVFGFKGSGDIPYFGYMAIRSALHFNPGWTVFFYCRKVPDGPNWDKIKSRVNVITVDDFDYFKTARLYHYAHKADVIRLLAINQVGGVYLDIDTITQRSYEDLRDAQFCMGVQCAGFDTASGLCNAVMIGQANAVFSTHWLAQYDYFRASGRHDLLWDYHSVKLPCLLMTRAPETIKVLDYRAFFYPLWLTIESQLFTDRGYERYNGYFESAYCFHLWNGGTSGFLEGIDEKFVRESKSIYASIARQVEGIGA